MASTASSTSLSSDTDVVTALRELTASVRELVDILKADRSDPFKSRQDIKTEQDEVYKAIMSERESGQPLQSPDSEGVELMSRNAIEKEADEHHQIYEDSWNKKNKDSTAYVVQICKDAYQLAFDRFPDIYQTFSRNNSPGLNDDMNNILFDTPTLMHHRSILIESIFLPELVRMNLFSSPREACRALFEFSRLPRLLAILIRLETRQSMPLACNGPITHSFDASTVLRVLAEVARLKSLHDFSRGHPLSQNTRDQLTMNSLLTHCYARRILSQPTSTETNQDTEDNSYLHQCNLIYDCLTAIDFIAPFREIRDPLRTSFWLDHCNDPIDCVFELVQRHHSLTREISTFLPLQLEPGTEEATFAPEQLSLEYLRTFAGLTVEWTDSLDEHLLIDVRRHAVKVFAHPTFLYNCVDIYGLERDYHEPTHLELAQTYALLFQPTCPFTRSIHRSPPELEKAAAATPKSPDRSPSTPFSQDIVESLWEMPLPPIHQAVFFPTRTYISNNVNNIENGGTSKDDNDNAPMSVSRFTTFYPYQPEDILFIRKSILDNPTPQHEMAYAQFSYFEPRLRKLQAFVEGRRVRSLRQIWNDRRDSRAWWVFWGGFCLAVIVCVELGIICYRLGKLVSSSSASSLVASSSNASTSASAATAAGRSEVLV